MSTASGIKDYLLGKKDETGEVGANGKTKLIDTSLLPDQIPSTVLKQLAALSPVNIPSAKESRSMAKNFFAVWTIDIMFWFTFSTLGIFFACKFFLEKDSSSGLAIYTSVTWGFAYLYAMVTVSTSNRIVFADDDDGENNSQYRHQRKAEGEVGAPVVSAADLTSSFDEEDELEPETDDEKVSEEKDTTATALTTTTSC